MTLIHDFRQRSGTVYHQSCTCRMGPDPNFVVDPRLKVHGIEALRVCDASVFPNLIAGNTNAPAMMVGWRGRRSSWRMPWARAARPCHIRPDLIRASFLPPRRGSPGQARR
jgi:choline dehydrogenase-like flavoprotein